MSAQIAEVRLNIISLSLGVFSFLGVLNTEVIQSFVLITIKPLQSMTRVKSQIKHQLVSVILSPSQSKLHRQASGPRKTRMPIALIVLIIIKPGLNRLQKSDFADLIRRLLACIGNRCHGDDACAHCRKLTKLIWKYYINQAPLVD